MSYTITEYLTKNGYKIGLDAVRVSTQMLYTNARVQKSHFESDIAFLNADNRYFTYDADIGIVADPTINEYYMSTNKELLMAVAKEFDMPLRKCPINGGMVDFKFIDPKMQKAWEKHIQYMAPENVEKREIKKRNSEYRAKRRAIAAQKTPKFNTIKDIIRRGGFVPDDYVEIKEGMKLNDRIRGETTVLLAKEEAVSAKSYVVFDSGNVIIASVDTNEAIVSHNQELANEFLAKGFQVIEPEEMPIRFYAPFEFKDKETQKRWENHLKRAEKQEALVKRETMKYIKQHYPELKKEANEENNRGFMSESALIQNFARLHVLKNRAAARRATRNMITTYDPNHEKATINALQEKANIRARVRQGNGETAPKRIVAAKALPVHQTSNEHSRV